jgi:hypothetical protein
MRSILLCVLLGAVTISPVIAAQATVEQRLRMSVEIASYIRDFGKRNEFHTERVDLGPTAIEGNWALADWRSDDGKLHGQVSFAYICDHWNLEKVRLGMLLPCDHTARRQQKIPLPQHELAERPVRKPVVLSEISDKFDSTGQTVRDARGTDQPSTARISRRDVRRRAEFEIDVAGLTENAIESRRLDFTPFVRARDHIDQRDVTIRIRYN